MGIIYFLIAIAATTIGAITGISGGVIMRPAIDLLGTLDAASGSILASISVFCMTVISIGKRVQQKAPVNLKISIPLAIGALVGGKIGQVLLSQIIARMDNSTVIITQNTILAIVIAGVFLYMLNKAKIPSLGLTGVTPAILVGVFLGIQAAFLGIGGGPINVAVIIYLFGLDTKSAATCSLITIMAAQTANLFSVYIGGGFAPFELHMLPWMVTGAVLGGFLGASVSKYVSEKNTDVMFDTVLIVVFCICVTNIIRAL